MTKFLDIFTPIQKGNFGLTDEAIYKSIQHGGQFIPVYGGTQQHETAERFASEYGKTKYDEPITIFSGDGIIISLDGSSGSMTYVTSKRFALNHHAGFFQLKEDAKQVVVPEFFSIFFEKQLREASLSEGSKTLTPNMLKSMDFDIPQYDVQNEIMLEIRPLLKAKENVNNLLLRINSIKERVLSVDYQNYQEKDVPISKILECHGGNTGLTEKKFTKGLLRKDRDMKYFPLQLQRRHNWVVFPNVFFTEEKSRYLRIKKVFSLLGKVRLGPFIIVKRENTH